MKTNKEALKEMESLYAEYEKEVENARSSGLLTEKTAKTYLLHSQNFVRWCNDDFIPGERNSPR